MLNIFKGFADVSSFLFPGYCFNCEKTIKDSFICADCLKQIERVPSKVCLKCGIAKAKCDCDRFAYHFNAVVSPFYNDGVAQSGVYLMKFAKKLQLCEFYGREMADCVKNRFDQIHFDGIAYVPASAVSYFKRGFNQSKELATVLSRYLNLPIMKNILRRKLFTRTQHTLTGIDERYKNAYESFSYCRKLNGGKILLVDDIKTTGASLDSCARQLLAAGADEVFCVTALLGNNKNS